MNKSDHVLFHFIGDYLLQSDWMANEKTKSSYAAAAHAATYTLPFLLLKPTWKQAALIAGTHFLIDRFRLARYVVWAKNWLAPKGEDHTLTATGYPSDRPVWMSAWLMIIADNTLHVLLNRIILGKENTDG